MYIISKVKQNFFKSSFFYFSFIPEKLLENSNYKNAIFEFKAKNMNKSLDFLRLAEEQKYQWNDDSNKPLIYFYQRFHLKDCRVFYIL